MTIEQFASKHRLKTRLDDCGEKIIPGRTGQLYEYSDTEMGVMFMPGKWTPRTWGNFKRAGIALSMTLRQNGDTEGCLSFDPGNPEQLKLALKIAWIKKRRILSELQRAAILKARQSLRQGLQNPL